MAIEKPRGFSFVRRVYPARMLGLALACLIITTVLLPLHTSPLLWVVLIYNCFVWPHLAYFIASSSNNPIRFERLHLLGDAAMGGFWVVAMGFNPLSSSIITMMLWMNLIGAGGVKLFGQGVLSTFAGVAFGLWMLGFRWYPAITDTLVYASIPMLMLYPIFIGSITYNLSMLLHKQKELLKHLSRTDSLTGILNRGYWEARAREEIVRARRNHSSLSLIMIDIDHFKRINDTYGHIMGDYVLKRLAEYLQMNLRETELLGRYGGEEFAIILPDADHNRAWQMGERLREFIEQAVFQDPNDPHHTKLHCTISLGVAAFSDGDGDFSSWVRAADLALYQAKGTGRNRCISYVRDNPQQILESS
ncbi:MAG: diguanylate cyclase [Pseudomonadota bacterium]